MRITSFILITAAVIGLSGCSGLVSLHPFVEDKQSVFDPALAGVWTDAKNEEFYVIRQDGDGYKIRILESGEAQSFSARLFKSGDLRILDLVSTNDDPFQLAVHTPVRIWIDGSTLRFATLDSAWLKENARKQLAIQDVGGRALITAPGDAVLRFLISYGAGDEAYGKPSMLYKQQ